MLSRFVNPARTALTRSFAQVVKEPATWNSPAATVTMLPNGLKVVSRETFSESTTVGLYVTGGARAETVDSIGSSYALQELAASGTKKHPNLVGDVESMGASLSVTAGKEATSYSMTLGKSDLGKGVGILADMATAPNLEEFDKLKPAMCAAMENSTVPTQDVIMDRLHMCAFRDSTLGYSALDPEAVGALTKSGLAGYVASTAVPNNMVLAADGPVKHEEILKLATASFGGLKAGAGPVLADKPYFCGAELVYRNDEMGPTAYVAVGYEGVSAMDPDAVTFMLMAQIIGNYKKDTGLVPGTISGNRVTNNVANKMGVGCADAYNGFNIFYKDTGIFGFYIVCDEVAVEHAVGELMLGVNILSFSVTDEEVERAKRELKTRMFGLLDSSAASCTFLAESVMQIGRVVPPAELCLRLDAIDAEEIKRVAYAKLNDAEIAVTGLGPLHGLKSYYELRQATCMVRY